MVTQRAPQRRRDHLLAGKSDDVPPRHLRRPRRAVPRDRRPVEAEAAAEHEQALQPLWCVHVLPLFSLRCVFYPERYVRVLFWNNVFWPEAIGGTEVWATRLLPALLQRGHDVGVVTTRSRPDLPEIDRYRGVPVHRLALHEALLSGDPARIGDARRSVARLLAELRPEVLHVGAIDPSAFFHLHAAAPAGIPELLSLGDSLPEYDTTPTTLTRRAVG